MSHLTDDIYREYHFSIGDANFVFFSNLEPINLSANVGMPHSHKLFEIFHMLEGNVTLVTDTHKQLITKGNTLIVSPGTSHAFTIPGDTKRIAMVFDVSKNPGMQGPSYYDVFMKILEDDFLILDSELLTTCFHRCAGYIESSYPEKDELITACLHETMTLLKATNSQHEKFPLASSFTDTDSSRTYVIDHYFTHNFQHGSLTELSKLLHLSTQQTQRIIKKMYGQSFSERLTMMKMQFAKTLLQDPNLLVTQIAEKCGYTGPNGFFVAFKKYYGSTPNKLKKTKE